MAILLQDMRKKATKEAYKKEILDCCYDVILDFIEHDNLPKIDLNNINEVCDFMLLNVFNAENNHTCERKRYPNLHYRITEWVKNRINFGYETYPICEWLVENKLVNSELIPKNKDLTLRMQEAAERHFSYIAKTFIDNASHSVLAKLY